MQAQFGTTRLVGGHVCDPVGHKYRTVGRKSRLENQGGTRL